MSIAVLIFLVMVVVIVTPMAAYLLFRAINSKVKELEQRRDPDALPASELREMIGDAVRDEMEPIERRLLEQDAKLKDLSGKLGPLEGDDQKEG